MVLDRFFCFPSRMLRIIIVGRHAQSMGNGRNRFRRVHVERKYQQFPECYLKNKASDAFVGLKKAKLASPRGYL